MRRRGSFEGESIEELAQNGSGIKRATQSLGEVLRCLVARIRALCAFKRTLMYGGIRILRMEPGPSRLYSELL